MVPASAAFNLDTTTRGTSNITTNIPGYEGTYKTLEISANKRYTQRWSINASFSYTWSEEYGNNYFNNRTGTAVPTGGWSFFGSFPTNPNEKTFNEFTNWSLEDHRLSRCGLGPARVTRAEVAERRPVWPYNRRQPSITTRSRCCWSSRSARGGRTR